MTDTHHCPKCGVEYYAHIKICPDCQIPIDQPLEEPVRREITREEAVSIATGPVSTLKNLETLLEDHNIAHLVELVESGRQIDLTPSAEFGVFIHPDDVERVAGLMREEVHEEFPELEKADQALDSGKCPACGAETGGAKICPECELPLWFEE